MASVMEPIVAKPERTDRDRLIGLTLGFLVSMALWAVLIIGVPALVYLVLGR